MPLLMCDLDDTLVERPPLFRAWAEAFLAEHGIMGREYPDVRANTVSSFALGDYEWLLAFEAEDLGRIVDVMRHLRGAKARAHTREELPFLTGIRKPLAEIAAALG